MTNRLFNIWKITTMKTWRPKEYKIAKIFSTFFSILNKPSKMLSKDYQMLPKRRIFTEPSHKTEGDFSKGCDAVGTAVASDNRRPPFESSHWQLSNCFNLCWKDENKEVGYGHFLTIAAYSFAKIDITTVALVWKSFFK